LQLFPSVDLVLTYVNDPLYVNFTNNVKVYKGDQLVIEGHRLDVASELGEVRVMIGSEYCNITSLTATQLLCTPPQFQPPPEGDSSDNLPQVLTQDLLVKYHFGSILPFTKRYRIL
jgi:hypothetical protein